MTDDLRERVAKWLWDEEDAGAGPWESQDEVTKNVYRDIAGPRLALIRAERAAARETPDGDWQALAMGENEYIYGHASVIAKVQKMLQRLVVAESMIYRARAEEERRANS